MINRKIYCVNRAAGFLYGLNVNCSEYESGSRCERTTMVEFIKNLPTAGRWSMSRQLLFNTLNLTYTFTHGAAELFRRYLFVVVVVVVWRHCTFMLLNAFRKFYLLFQMSVLPFPYHTHTRTHTHIRLTALSKARDSKWQWHQLGHMQVFISLQTDNHATPPLSFFYRPDALPAAQPTASKHWRQLPFPYQLWKKS